MDKHKLTFVNQCIDYRTGLDALKLYEYLERTERVVLNERNADNDKFERL